MLSHVSKARLGASGWPRTGRMSCGPRMRYFQASGSKPWSIHARQLGYSAVLRFISGDEKMAIAATTTFATTTGKAWMIKP